VRYRTLTATQISQLRSLRCNPHAVPLEDDLVADATAVEVVRALGCAAGRSAGGPWRPRLTLSLELMSELAMVDGSIGWVAMVGAANSVLLRSVELALGRGPEPEPLTADDAGRRFVAANALACGSVRRGGLSGRWRMVSGACDADVFVLGFRPPELPEPGTGSSLAVVAVDAVACHGDWDAVGLPDSDSGTVEVAAHPVDPASCIGFVPRDPRWQLASEELPATASTWLVAGIAAVAHGLVGSAHRELRDLDRAPDAVDLAEKEAAQGWNRLLDLAARADAAATDRRPTPPACCAELRLVAMELVDMCLPMALEALGLAGTAGIGSSSPVGRAVCDLLVLRQHNMVSPRLRTWLNATVRGDGERPELV